VLKEEDLEVTELKQRQLSRPFPQHLFTFSLAVKGQPAVGQLEDLMVVVLQVPDTTMKVQVVEPQTSEPVLI
jgi:hypothetical protein